MTILACVDKLKTKEGIQNLARPTKRGGGPAPGFQGYSPADCTALVMAVKKMLPLGSQE
ncbi:hypothetical protein VP01_12001g1 [Puccinia sorghi]|uniref:Uncharacterized protein n=1 Tax=Puccinia sorghi TaxID=27349 RepID=A0A0L6VQR0_9BASI|nr:hypothetical protein VP01_12001g1 [Puccinia sorghi]